MLNMNVVRAAQCKVEHAGPYSVIAEAVDKDEATGVAVVLIGIKGNWPVEAEVAFRNTVKFECAGGSMLKRIDVDLMFDAGNGGGDGARADLEQIGAAGQHGFVMHPHYVAFKLVCDFRGCFGSGKNVPA